MRCTLAVQMTMLMELLRASSTWLSLVKTSIHSGQCLIFPNVYICGQWRVNQYVERKMQRLPNAEVGFNCAQSNNRIIVDQVRLYQSLLTLIGCTWFSQNSNIAEYLPHQCNSCMYNSTDYIFHNHIIHVECRCVVICHVGLSFYLERFPTHPVFTVQFGWPAATEIMKALSKFSWQINLKSLFDLHNP